jgi:hypothetical protein
MKECFNELPAWYAMIGAMAGLSISGYFLYIPIVKNACRIFVSYANDEKEVEQIWLLCSGETGIAESVGDFIFASFLSIFASILVYGALMFLWPVALFVLAIYASMRIARFFTRISKFTKKAKEALHKHKTKKGIEDIDAGDVKF